MLLVADRPSLTAFPAADGATAMWSFPCARLDPTIAGAAAVNGAGGDATGIR